MDGLTPTTADALSEESRWHSMAGCLQVTPSAAQASRERQSMPGMVHGEKIHRVWHQPPAEACPGADMGGHLPADSKAARVQQDTGRLHLVAPACWKSGNASARRRINRAVLMPAPAQWVHSRTVSHRATPPAPSPVAVDWLLPPMWPLDGWRVMAAAGLRRVADLRIALWARARNMTWPAPVSTRWLVAGAAVAGVAFLSLSMGLPYRGVRSTPTKALAAMPAAPSPRPLPAMPAPVSATPVAIAVAPVPVSRPEPSPAVLSGPVETGRSLVSDVSTMDLMMPIEEPDLDIASRQSLWSEVGKAYGVDPLLLYSVALVESKALYPDGKLAPTPWLFRVNDHLVRGERHEVQLAMAAASQFGSAVQDVGIMQVYYPMHRDAVRDPLALLDPKTNITVAAKILRDGMHETRDPVLGVGYYHSHTPELARDYGTAVLAVYQRLKSLYRSGRAVQIAARQPVVHA